MRHSRSLVIEWLEFVAWVQSLVRELISCKRCYTAKNKNKRKLKNLKKKKKKVSSNSVLIRMRGNVYPNRTTAVDDHKRTHIVLHWA